MKRWQNRDRPVQRRRPFSERFRIDGDTVEPDDYENDDMGSEGDGEEAWRNSEGERLGDYGVDEEIEFYEDEVPLAELIRRRKGLQPR